MLMLRCCATRLRQPPVEDDIHRDARNAEYQRAASGRHEMHQTPNADDVSPLQSRQRARFR